MTEPTPAGTPPVEGIGSRSNPFPVEETLARLQQAIQRRELTLIAHIEHSGEAKRIGLQMQEAHVLIFGNPKAGTPLMIASPPLALDLPLKALVWQSEDGRVWVSSTSATYADWAALADPLQINAACASFPLDARRLSRPPDESHR